jgi:hypothetical protein
VLVMGEEDYGVRVINGDSGPELKTKVIPFDQ